jgi:hypothetical protein
VKSISYTAPTTSGTIAGNSGTILMNNEGISTVSFTATDYACHTSFGYTYTVKNDRIPPFTTASITGTPGTNGAFIESAQVTIAATDATSGVAATSFSLDGITWQPYTDPLLITTIGTTTIFYRSTDDADNLEGTKSVSVKIQAKQVDSIPPAVTTTSPVAGTTVSVPSSIAVNFSEVVVNGDTIGSVTLKKGKTLIAKSATANGSTLIITPTTPLAKGATYTVSIPAGAVKDSAGNALAAAYSFSFTTARR